MSIFKMVYLRHKDPVKRAMLFSYISHTMELDGKSRQNEKIINPPPLLVGVKLNYGFV